MRHEGKEQLWTKNFIMMSVVNFFITLIFFLLIITIASFAVEKYDASTSAAGFVSSIFVIGALFGRLFAGRVITSFGSKKTLFYGLFFFIALTLCYFIAMSMPLLIIIRLLHGLSLGVVTTATGTIIAQMIPNSRKGEGIGYYSMSGVLASSIGPFIGLLLIPTTYSFQAIFTLNAILSICCLLMYFFINLEDYEPSAKKSVEGSSKRFNWRNYIEPKAVPVSLVALIIGFSYSGVMSFLAFYIEEINLVKAGSLFFFIYSIVVLFSRPFTGPLMDRRGATIVIVPCLIIFALGMVLFSQASTGVLLLTSAILIGFGYGNFNSVAQALALKVTEKHRLGLATATYYILFDIGLGIGPFVLGNLVSLLGYRMMFLLMVPVILLALVLYMFIFRKKQNTDGIVTEQRGHSLN